MRRLHTLNSWISQERITLNQKLRPQTLRAGLYIHVKPVTTLQSTRLTSKYTLQPKGTQKMKRYGR
jgi:hypothetical protein